MAHVDVNGLRIDLPAEVARLSRGGIADFLVSNYGMTPEELGIGESGDPTEGVGVSEAQAVSMGNILTGGRSGDAGIEALQQQRPIASAAGASLPFIPAGGSMLGAAAIGGGLEAIRPDSTATSIGVQGAIQGGLTLAGKVAGELVGRSARGAFRGSQNAIRALRGNVKTSELPSGIRSTVGKLLDSRQMQQAEASLARNPITARKFVAIDKANEKLIRGKALRWLGVADAPNLEQGVARALSESVDKINRGLPDNAVVSMSQTLDNHFKILNKVSGEAFDLPAGQRSVSGAAMKSVMEDLKAGVRSTSSTVRRRSRAALKAIDGVLAKNPAVDQPLYREGSQQYRRYERITRKGVMSRADREKINPTSLLNAMEKGNKGAVRTRGVASSGDDLTDDLIKTAADFEKVGSLTPDSGTPTGLALPVVAADIVATGGIGTAAAFAGAEVVESPFGLGFVDSVLRSAKGAGVGAAQTFRAGGQLLPAPGRKRDDESNNNNPN